MTIPYGYCAMKFRFDQGMLAHLRTIPGTRWDADRRAWLVPLEMQKDVLLESQRRRITSSFDFCPSRVPANVTPNSALYSFQTEIVERALQTGRHLICVETGLGKTPIAIETARRSGATKILVVTQKGIISHWETEIDKWWPACPAEFLLTNYEQLEKHTGKQFDFVILDEVHNVKNYRTDRSKSIRKLLSTNPAARCLALSATPVDKPDEIHAIVDTLWPKRFGAWGTFGDRCGFRDTYCTTSEEVINGREITKVTGLLESKLSELRNRISYLASFATKLEFGHLLPAFTVTQRRISAKVPADTSVALSSERAFTASLISASESKVGAAVEWVNERLTAGDRKLMLVTYRIELVAQLYDALSSVGLTRFCVTGETGDREARLDAARAAKECILIASMKAIGTGINLTEFPNVLVCELYWSINQMKQLLGRFSRLSGTTPAQVDLLTLAGSGDEIIASRLLKKIDALNAILKNGQADTKLTEALTNDDDDEAFKAELRAAFASGNGDQAWCA